MDHITEKKHEVTISSIPEASHVSASEKTRKTISSRHAVSGRKSQYNAITTTEADDEKTICLNKKEYEMCAMATD